MNNTESLLKCACESCANSIEYPTSAAGLTIACPHCAAETILALDLSEETASRDEFSVSDILQQFQGTIEPTPTSFFYKIGLILVSATMVILPLIYLALVCLAAWAVYFYATHFSFLLTTRGGGLRLGLFKMMLYGGPLFVGAILVLFMVKPLFARRPRHAQPMALNPAFEPKVYAFIARICDLTGAPMPNRIDMDCELNASASFRKGFGSLFSNDLVLTIGLPLVAGLNAREFAGVVAHEFGHFTQGFGMRLSYVIRTVNGWFARVVYDRDELDVWLEESSAEASDWRWAILVGCAQLGVWFSRQILKLLMFTGHAVSCFLLRQMEYDADSYEVKLAGSDVFESTTRRMHVLNTVLKPTYNTMRASFNLGRELPNDFSALLLKHDRALPDSHRTQLEDNLGLQTTGMFDTHPSSGDRIRYARQLNEPGIFHLDAPATVLFNHFENLSKQVTQVHYSDDLGIQLDGTRLVPVLREKTEEITPVEPTPVSAGRTGNGLRLQVRGR